MRPGCANCGKPLADHCRAHLIPCCPGKCGIEDAEGFEADDCELTGRRSARWRDASPHSRHRPTRVRP